MNIDDIDDTDKAKKNNKRQNTLATLYHCENVVWNIYRIVYLSLLIILMFSLSLLVGWSVYKNDFILTNCLMRLVEVINILEWSSITFIVTIIGIRMISDYILLYYNNRQ